MPPTTLPFRVVLPANTDRAVWLGPEGRQSGIGSSDVADILGVGSSSAQHVYYSKTGELPPDDDAGEYALWGSLDEETTAREWARRNRSIVRRIGLIARKDAAWQMCTLDRQIRECPEAKDRDQREICALEVKHRIAWKAGQWKRAVPDDVLAQTLWQIHVTGYSHIHVAVRIGGFDFRQFTVRRKGNEQLIDDIVTSVTRFWTENVLARRVPTLTGAENVDRMLDLFEELHPNRSGLASLDDSLSMEANEQLLAYELERLKAKRAGDAKDAAKTRLIELLGDNEAARLFDQQETAYGWDSTTKDGDPLVRESIDMDRLAEQFPDAYAACLRSTPVRRFNIAKVHRLTKDDLARIEGDDDVAA